MEQGQSEEDSAFDFLYADTKRIAQFLGQFSQFGHLTGITRTDGISRTGGGGINVGAAKVDKATSTNEAQTRQFDVKWLDPVRFLDEINRRGMIYRHIADAGIGQIVLLSGNLALFDLSTLKTVWSIKEFQQAMIAAAQSAQIAEPTVPLNRHERRKPQNKAVVSEDEKAQRAALELLPSLPHAVQACIFDDNELAVWCSLREEALATPASDLLLKHGCRVAGQWSMIGILDAYPEEGPNAAADASLEHIYQELAAARLGGLGALIGSIAPPIRQMLGRPATAYGVTPILIFREVSG